MSSQEEKKYTIGDLSQHGNACVYEAEGRFKKSAAELFDAQTNFLKGKILTVIDAALSDHRQCKATKDLIHEAFIGQQNYVRRLYSDGDSQAQTTS